jgi:hypothetical protein
MKIISPKLHAYIDYVIAAVLILFHWIFGYELDEASSWIPLILGVTFLTYSILTRFRDEHFGMIPLRIHLMLDMLVGVTLILVPWILGDTDRLPYLQSGLGVLILLIAFMTKLIPYGKIDPRTEA